MHEKDILYYVLITSESLIKSELYYHGSFGQTLRWIQKIDFMSRIEIFYIACWLGKKNVAPTLPVFQCIKRCVQFFATHAHNPIFYPSNYYGVSNLMRINWGSDQVEEYILYFLKSLGVSS